MIRTVPTAALVFACPLVAAADEAADEQKARLACESILTACEAFQTCPQNEKAAPPTVLMELVKPPFGGPSYLRNGAADLLDPWGNMLHYAVARNEKGELRAYVWSERTVGGKTKVVGTKPPEPKKK